MYRSVSCSHWEESSHSNEEGLSLLDQNLNPSKDFLGFSSYSYSSCLLSSRYRAGSNVNSYTTVKAIAEELRGLAVEFDLPIVSATQTTRSGYGSSDVELTDTSESFGLPATSDLMFALISTEELEGLGQIMVKKLKNRYNDLAVNKRFVVGIDRGQMRLYDCEQSAQEDILDKGDDTEYNEEKSFKDKFTKLQFG